MKPQKKTQDSEVLEGEKPHLKVACNQFNQHTKARNKPIKYRFSIVTEDYSPINTVKMDFQKPMQVESPLLYQDTSHLLLYNPLKVPGNEYFSIEKW